MYSHALLWGRFCYHPHFTDPAGEVPEGQVRHQRSRGLVRGRAAIQPRDLFPTLPDAKEHQAAGCTRTGKEPDPALVHPCPCKYRGQLPQSTSLHICLNGRTKSCKKLEGTAWLQSLHLPVLPELGETGQNHHTAVWSLSCAFPKGPPQTSCSKLSCNTSSQRDG